MFRRQWWLFGKTISDEGFSVSFIAKGKLLYELGGKRMQIVFEGDGSSLDVFHGSMSHWENDDSLIGEQADKQNVDNVTRALEWRGFSVYVVPRGMGW